MGRKVLKDIDGSQQSADFPSDKKQEAATALLRDAIHSLPIAVRASKILGPISRHLMAQIIPMIWNAARASRPGLAVGILRVLCNGMCAAQRFHMDDEDPDEPDSLSHHNEFPLLHQSCSPCSPCPWRGGLFCVLCDLCAVVQHVVGWT